MIDPKEEIAARIQAGRFCCKGRVQPCNTCKSAVFQGCYHLAEAVLTPIVEPEEGSYCK